VSEVRVTGVSHQTRSWSGDSSNVGQGSLSARVSMAHGQVLPPLAYIPAKAKSRGLSPSTAPEPSPLSFSTSPFPTAELLLRQSHPGLHCRLVPEQTLRQTPGRRRGGYRACWCARRAPACRAGPAGLPVPVPTSVKRSHSLQAGLLG